MNQKTLPLEHHLIENRIFPPSFSEEAHIRNFDQYKQLYDDSIYNSDIFWLQQSETLRWIKKPTKSLDYNWNSKQNIIEHNWFLDGILNVTVNCLDRHLEKKADKPAIVWQGDEDQDVKVISYSELFYEVCRFANGLKQLGVEKGDRVCIYMPMVPELAVAVLGCARIGAIHSVVFGGFSSEALCKRINDCESKVLVTANQGIRGGKNIHLKEIADLALQKTPSIQSVIVLKRTSTSCDMKKNRDVWMHDFMDSVSDDCEPEPMNAEDPLFILYTSGSTGMPKGVVHTQAGYLLHTSLTHRLIFDIQEDDIYWCTADIGWITGHSYVIYGPLANGSTTFMFEGIPSYPDPGRYWQIIEKHGITKFYTAPTILRSMISQGANWPEKFNLKTLKLLGTVGEPINPETWMWYRDVIGGGELPVVDTWWQTETGGIMISPFPYSHNLKPGSATLPFFGVEPIILKDDGSECDIDEGGSLCIRKPWPGMMRSLWKNYDLFVSQYFSLFPNYYFTGDGARKDADGDYWLLGRIDDVVNISGHRLSTAEVESALVKHKDIAEAAAVPVDDEISGQALVSFITLVETAKPSDSLKQEIRDNLIKEIGPIAKLKEMYFVPSLPKTRSGKIMRRILRKIAANDIENIGDVSTLADPDMIKQLVTIVAGDSATK